MIPSWVLSGRRGRRRGQGVKQVSKGVTNQVAQVTDSGPGEGNRGCEGPRAHLEVQGSVAALRRRPGLAGRLGGCRQLGEFYTGGKSPDTILMRVKDGKIPRMKMPHVGPTVKRKIVFSPENIMQQCLAFYASDGM